MAGIGHYGNSIGIATVGGEIYFEGPYEQNCLVNAMALGLIETDKLIRSRRRGRREHRRAVRRANGPRRDRRRVRAGLGRARRLRGQAPDGADRRPVHREEAARVLAGSAGPRAAGRAAGSRRRGPDLLVGRDGGQGRGRARSRRARACRCARRTWSRSRSWSASPRSGCSASSSPSKLDEVLAVCARWEVNGDRDRRGHRHAPPAGLRRRCAGRRHAGHRAGRRVPGLRPRARRARDPDLSGAAEPLLVRRTRARSWSALLGSSNVASRRWAFEQYDSIVGSRTVRRPEQADAAVLLLPPASANGDR